MAIWCRSKGRGDFVILRSWDQDGYRVAEVEWIQDIYPLEATRDRQDLQEMARGTSELALSWIRRAREAAQTACEYTELETLREIGTIAFKRYKTGTSNILRVGTRLNADYNVGLSI
ncbi:hypothetical protein IFM89_026909 [Coptis chinensis]|uniref:Uncharacterized protein n=1 Tax=Coptis chinensis TaxID=261450 RepID=A0A835IYL8_9MAGN|nr:hypothetical protein IFM89_026909 [Coptis chinensis]